MNAAELFDQFVAESREGLEAISRLLLAVERRSDDAVLLNDLFRSVHTLKGNCGLFEFKPLERAVHAGEDLLDQVRNGQLAYGPAIADALLDMLDFATAMVAAIDAQGSLPDEAAAQAEALATALRAHLKPQDDTPAPAPSAGLALAGTAAAAAAPDWLIRVPHDHQAPGRVALRYCPEPDCFFKGEDPWRLARETPGLLHLDVAAQQPWPRPDDFDCYRCNLDIVLVSSADDDALAHHFRYVSEQVQRWRIPAPAATDVDVLLRRRIEALWLDQIALLHQDRLSDGAVRAAHLALSNLQRLAGHDDAVPVPQAQSLARWAEAHELAGRGSRPVTAAPMTTAGLRALPSAEAQSAAAAQDGSASVRAAEPDIGPTPGGARVMKVAQTRIDSLMDLIGEMVVAKNALAYLSERAEQVFGQRELGREIKTQHAVINRIAEDLQRAIMDVRMLPMGTVFQRFPRLVRDLSRKLDKDVRLVIEGEDTEADKNVVEALADPLIHILRNSLDHGIEVPSRRLAAGKPAQGTIRVKAGQEGDRVVLLIADDGAGIDTARVKAKALQRGLISAERAQGLSDDEAAQLIFLAGLSTAETVSDLSGRGVGMDVVRSAVERINGSVTLENRPGQGTTLSLSLPLSMAVTNVMMIEAGGRRFGVPMDLIVETVRVPLASVHGVKGARTTVLRGRIVALLNLHDLLALDCRPRLNADREQAVLVLRHGGENVGLVVDDFKGTSDIILKPLEGLLAGHTGIAGTALLGDGSVLLILNPKELL